jgi:hypothetical protein
MLPLGKNSPLIEKHLSNTSGHNAAKFGGEKRDYDVAQPPLKDETSKEAA